MSIPSKTMTASPSMYAEVRALLVDINLQFTAREVYKDAVIEFFKLPLQLQRPLHLYRMPW